MEERSLLRPNHPKTGAGTAPTLTPSDLSSAHARIIPQRAQGLRPYIFVTQISVELNRRPQLNERA